MIHPIPSGTRDVLPDEMRELRAITEQLRGVWDAAGYGEIYTPALEYESVITRVELAALRPAYRVFDESGTVLVLRSDMTVPIARVVATRYGAAQPPLRFCYFAHSYRGVRPQRGQPREFLQAGVELIGAGAPGGTAETLTVLCNSLDAVGLRRYRVGLGDATLYPRLLDSLGVGPEDRARLLGELARGDFVGLEAGLRELLGSDEQSIALLLEVPQLRGGAEILHGPSGPVADAVAGLRAIRDLLADEVAERVIFDLGLSRAPGYYTGAVFEVYDPALGMPIGGGGRYDNLLGEFGRALPAAGFALEVDRLHLALAAEERL